MENIQMDQVYPTQGMKNILRNFPYRRSNGKSENKVVSPWQEWRSGKKLNLYYFLLMVHFMSNSRVAFYMKHDPIH
jgi:hypothetical protein